MARQIKNYIFTAYKKGNKVWSMGGKRKETLEEAKERERREAEERGLKGEVGKFSAKEKRCYDLLNDLVEELDRSGVDVSYFPYRAEMVLIEFVKKIAQLK